MIQKKGYKAENPDFPELKDKYFISTFCIPIMAKLQFKTAFPLYIIGGGEVALVLSHKYEKNNNLNDLKEDTKNFNLGVVFGLGIEINIAEFQGFFVEVRYHHGFYNMLKESFGDRSLKTHALLVVLGISNH